MKKLFRIGGGMFIYSIIPILSWIVLSFVLRDSRISNVFSIIYSVQFVYILINKIFASGANIKKEKEKDKNAIGNGMFWGTIFSVVIYSLLLIFVDEYIEFFGQDVKFYRPYVMYGIALLFVQTLFSFVIEKLYFQDKEKTANIHLICFNVVQFVTLILSCLIIKNVWIALSIPLVVLIIYVICLHAWQFEKFKIDFTFLKNIKYEASGIASSALMMIAYLFGYKTCFLAGEEYLAALNLVALCTDTQWDMSGAISTTAKVNICKNRFEYREHVKNSYVYMSILALSSVVMTLVIAPFNGVTLKIALIYLAFQVLDMLLYPIQPLLLTFIQLEYSPVLTTIIALSLTGLRALLAVIITSPFCTDIAQLTEGVTTLITVLIIKFSKFETKNKKLKVKGKTKVFLTIQED